MQLPFDPTSVDPTLLNGLAGIFFSLLYSVAKPDTWSGEKKEKVALVGSLILGLAVAFLERDKGGAPFDYVKLSSVTLGASLGFYHLLGARLEQRAGWKDTTPPTPPTLTTPTPGGSATL